MKVTIRAGDSVLIFTLSFLLVAMCVAQEKHVSRVLEEGIGQYKHENYEEALPLLQKARDEDPTSTLAAYYLGLNYKQLQNYQKAAPHLRDAVTYSPKIKGALIELIDCLYHLGKLTEAKKWITEAEAEGIRPAQTAFLKGLVFLKENEPQEAITHFERSKELDASMTQGANYQIGIAHLKAKNLAYAQEAFKEVVIVDPLSNLAEYANEYINVLEDRERALRPWKFSLGTHWQYDDNVILKPDDVSVPTDVANNADWRMAYTSSIEYNRRISERFGIKGQHLCYFAKQNDLGFYDTLSNTVVIQPSVYFEDSLLSFPATYTHSMVDDRSYLSNPSFSSVYNNMISPTTMVQAYLKYNYKDYFWRPSSANENRDGHGLGMGLGWYCFFARKKGFVNLRYGFDREWTKGSNWDYLGNRITLTTLVPVCRKLNMTLTGSVYFQDFQHPHDVFVVQREDNIYSASALFAYELYRDCELQMQYTYVKAESNIGIYTYDRNIYSVGVQFNF